MPVRTVRPHPFASPRDRVFEPGPHKVFVFGSNLAGQHGAGAAQTAHEVYGAPWGVGEGLMAPLKLARVRQPCMTYALPTKDAQYRVRSLAAIRTSVNTLLHLAEAVPPLEFFVTRVGCGFAGYRDEDIAPMFVDSPANVILPIGWDDPFSPGAGSAQTGPLR